MLVGVFIFSIIALQMPMTFAEENVDAPPVEVSEALPADDVEDPIVAADPAPESLTLLVAPEIIPVDSPATSTPPLDTTVASTTNAATTTNDVLVTADTGDNTASSTDPIDLIEATSSEPVLGTSSPSVIGTTTIITGDAVASADIINVVNVNIFNSDALFVFLSRLFSGAGSFDLRSLFQFQGPTACAGCAMSTSTISSGTPVSVTASNDANINNSVIVRSGTGNNTASSTGGAEIMTGDAYANANVVNVANTNIIDSQYLMLVFNSYGGLEGDVILPTASFFEQFLQAPASTTSSSGPVSVDIQNSADVDTSVVASADTGGNSATSTSSSTPPTIDTGNAVTGTTVVNDINQNHIGGSRVAIIFRVFGNWLGSAYNVPTSFMWNNMPIGIQFFGGSGGASGNGSPFTADISNTASISNNVSVSASTGGNSASGAGAGITTGNAYAAATVINTANTNIIGHNWITAIINIFGDWNGNVSFGQPNLWVGTRADFKNSNAGAGSEVTFSYTIKNNGDAPAHGVRLSHVTDSSLLSFGDQQSGSWSLDDLNPGEVREISQTAQIAKILPPGSTPVSNSISVTESETDGNKSDNTDTIGIALAGSVVNIGNSFRNPLGPAKFKVLKSQSATSTTASSTVKYTVHVVNESGYASGAKIHDEITNESGEVIHVEEWDLGAVFAYEEITVTYTAYFSASTTPGIYTNSAQVVSTDSSFGNSPIATTTLLITAPFVPITLNVEVPVEPEVFALIPLSNNPLAEIGTTTATTTEIATTSPMLILSGTEVNPNIDQRVKSGMFANAFSALGGLSWYWYAALLGITGLYILYRNRGLFDNPETL